MSLPRQDESADVATKHFTVAPRPTGLAFRLLNLCFWLVALSLALVAGARLVYHDATHFLVWLNAFTRCIYLPAYVVLAWAIWKRRWWLALISVVIVSLHIAWLVPDFVPHGGTGAESAADASAPRLRLFFANVNCDNVKFDSLLQEIKRANPDILIFAEFTWPWRNAFGHSPIMEPYRYGSGRLKMHPGSVNVFSRLPVKGESEEFAAGRGIQTIEVPLGSQLLRIVGLHAPRPMAIRDFDYEGFWRRAIPLLLNEKGPTIVMGDCNATQYSLVYQRITSDRLRSAHEDRGRGYATSWPNGQVWLPPIRIDQAFISPEVECLRISEGEGRGSDHKPLILDVRLRAGR